MKPPSDNQPWQRKEVIGDATLYLGDCLEIMPTLDKVDAVVTDPPYGIGFNYGTDYIDDPRDYISYLWAAIEESEKHIDKGCIAVFQAAKNARYYAEWFPRNWRLITVGKKFGQWMPTHIQWRTDFIIYWLVKQEPSEIWDTINVPRDYYVSDRVCVTSGPNKRPDHPCPRPLDAMNYLIDILTRPGSLVLDPFMGSGTTLLACQQLGRKGIGIEIEPKYFDIACKRIDQAERQGRLFEKKPPKREQLAL